MQCGRRAPRGGRPCAWPGPASVPRRPHAGQEEPPGKCLLGSRHCFVLLCDLGHLLHLSEPQLPQGCPELRINSSLWVRKYNWPELAPSSGRPAGLQGRRSAPTPAALGTSQPPGKADAGSGLSHPVARVTRRQTQPRALGTKGRCQAQAHQAPRGAPETARTCVPLKPSPQVGHCCNNVPEALWPGDPCTENSGHVDKSCGEGPREDHPSPQEGGGPAQPPRGAGGLPDTWHPHQGGCAPVAIGSTGRSLPGSRQQGEPLRSSHSRPSGCTASRLAAGSAEDGAGAAQSQRAGPGPALGRRHA